MIIFKGDLSPLIIYGCRGGGTGRHAGLKILYHLNDVRVRFPPAVLVTKQKPLIVNTFNGFFMPISNKRVTKKILPFINQFRPTMSFHSNIKIHK